MVLVEVWKQEVKVKGDFARTHADMIAMAASLSLITTRVGPNVFGGAWQITGKGLSYINETEDGDE
jgi:hypothetical protein